MASCTTGDSPNAAASLNAISAPYKGAQCPHQPHHRTVRQPQQHAPDGEADKGENCQIKRQDRAFHTHALSQSHCIPLHSNVYAPNVGRHLRVTVRSACSQSFFAAYTTLTCGMGRQMSLTHVMITTHPAIAI